MIVARGAGKAKLYGEFQGGGLRAFLIRAAAWREINRLQAVDFGDYPFAPGQGALFSPSAFTCVNPRLMVLPDFPLRRGNVTGDGILIRRTPSAPTPGRPSVPVTTCLCFHLPWLRCDVA